MTEVGEQNEALYLEVIAMTLLHPPTGMLLTASSLYFLPHGESDCPSCSQFCKYRPHRLACEQNELERDLTAVSSYGPNAELTEDSTSVSFWKLSYNYAKKSQSYLNQGIIWLSNRYGVVFLDPYYVSILNTV